MDNFSIGLMCLRTSGYYTQSKFLPGTAEIKKINYKVLRQESNLRLCDAGAPLSPLRHINSIEKL